MTGSIYAGIGGWTFEPWRGVFYPSDLTQKRELEYASRALTSIEINGTYYSTFKPDSWMKWRDETPDGFVFSVKASRFCTNRKILSEGGESFDKFLSQGLTLLGNKLGPINWQFMTCLTIVQARPIRPAPLAVRPVWWCRLATCSRLWWTMPSSSLPRPA